MTISTGAVVRACTFGAFIAALLVVIDGPSPLVFDAAGYWELGTAVAQGDWWLHSQPIAYRTPGYPWLIGICQLLAGPYALLCLMLVQCIMSAASIPLVAAIAKRLAPTDFDHIASSGAAIVMAMFLSRLFWTRTVLGETLFIFSLLVHVLCFVLWWQEGKRVKWGALIGLSFALMILVRPIGQWLWLAHLVWLIPWLQSYRRSRSDKAEYKIRSDTATDALKFAEPEFGSLRRVVTSVLLAVMVAAICLIPWYYRNANLFGRPFLTEFLGRNIWIVTFQDQAGAGLSLPASVEAHRLSALADNSREKPVDLIKTWQVSELLTSSGMADDEADRLMRTISLQALKQNPGVWAEKAGRRLVNFFRCVPDSYPAFVDPKHIPNGQYVWDGSDWGSRVVQKLCIAPSIHLGTAFTCLFLFANGILIAWKPYRFAGLWLAAIVGYFALITALVEIPDYRYRMVIEPFQAIVLGLGISVIAQWRELSREQD